MSRIRREELVDDLGMQVVGFMGEDGATLNDVEDRFNTCLKLKDTETGDVRYGSTLARTGIKDLTMTEVMALGFTTIEYQWMLRYDLEAPPGGFICSELELNALVMGHPPDKVTGIRLTFQDAPNGAVTTNQFRKGPNHRTRGADQNSPHHALGWVDHQGKRVRHVADRFQARYLFDSYTKGREIMVPLSERGVFMMDLTSMVVLGFSADEYRAMYAYEEETGNFVQSEDHLDEIMGYSVDNGFNPPSR